MDKTATNLARLRAYDENPWDESEHPRAENGRFTSGGGNASGGAGKKSKSLRSVLNQGPEVAKGESQWEHEQNIKLMKGLEQAEKDEKHQIVISWIVHDLRNGMSAKEAFAKADKDVQNGRFGGGPFAQESLHKWWKKWSYKWGPQEEEG